MIIASECVSTHFLTMEDKIMAVFETTFGCHPKVEQQYNTNHHFSYCLEYLFYCYRGIAYDINNGY